LCFTHLSIAPMGRVAMIMRKIGVDDERFEDFIYPYELWHPYIKTGLNPELLKKQVDELYYFQSQNNGLGTAVSIVHICDNINNLKSEEATLNNGVAGLKSRKERVRKRKFRTASPES